MVCGVVKGFCVFIVAEWNNAAFSFDLSGYTVAFLSHSFFSIDARNLIPLHASLCGKMDQ